MKIIFDVKHLYYLPQYLPVIAQLQQIEVECLCVFYKNDDKALQAVCEKTVVDEGLTAIWCRDWEQALSIYMQEQADWVVFGNAVTNIDQIHRVSKTVMMLHGIGPKAVYYDMPKEPMTVRFVEGQYRLKRLQSMYPDGNFVDTGYAKLDPAFCASPSAISLSEIGLDPNKKTILYAPTFYPSSIELMPKRLDKLLVQYNLIVKPHFFTLTKAKYRSQRKAIERWQRSDNVYVCSASDYNLVPFMTVSDLMVSDASSAIFEFAALDKPVVWCDFYKLRWSYRGVFKFRLKQRVDTDIDYFEQVGWKAKSANELLVAIGRALDEPEKKRIQRRAVIEELAGSVDGLCSRRIVEYFLEN